MIRQINNRDFSIIITTKESRTDIISVSQEHGGGGDGRHFCEAGELGLHVCLVEFGAVGVVGGCVCGVVVHEDYIYVSGGLEEGEEGVVLVGFAAVDEGEVFLRGNEGGVGVVVEGVGVDGVFVHEC